MGFVKIGLDHILAVIILFLFSSPAFSQPQPIVYQCLTKGYEVEKNYFAKNKNYLLNIESLVKLMPETCRKNKYEVLKHGQTGFRLLMEWKGRIWSMTETEEIVSWLKSDPVAHPVQVQTDAPRSRSSHLNSERSDAPPPALAMPTVSLPSVGERPQLKAATPGSAAIMAKPLGPAASPSLRLMDFKLPQLEVHEDAETKLRNCFSKSAYETPKCEAFFDDIDVRCRGVISPPSDLCVEFEKAMNAVDLETCYDDPANYGKCELRRAQLEKKCSGGLNELKSECRMFHAFLSTFVPGKHDAKVRTPAEQETTIRPVASCARGNREMCVAEYCQKATLSGATKDDLSRCAEAQGLQSGRSSLRYIEKPQPMDSSLGRIMQLRPVVYRWKASDLEDIGFVAEEVATVDPRLMTYSEEGQVQGVKYGQISALLTRAVQELYGICKGGAPTQAKDNDVTKRVEVLEQKNSQLQRDNENLRNQLTQQAKELNAIKVKLGF